MEYKTLRGCFRGGSTSGVNLHYRYIKGKGLIGAPAHVRQRRLAEYPLRFKQLAAFVNVAAPGDTMTRISGVHE